MNKKLLKILGVVSVLATLASVFGIATPAVAADRAWGASSTPSALTFQVAAGKDASFLTIAPNGDVFVVDTLAATNVVYKSTTGGAKWTASTVNPWGAANPVTAIAVSPAYAIDGTVVVAAQLATGPQVYISTAGGGTFAQLGGPLTATATEKVMSIAFSPTYASGSGEIMVGTSNTLAGANYGNVYIWGRGGVLTWAGQGLLEDITSVAFSPNYPIDATILAVGSLAVPSTQLHTKVSTAAWDVTILPAGPVAINAAGGMGDGSAIILSQIQLPSDYNASLPATRRVYVSTVSGFATDNVYRITGPTGVAALVALMNPLGGGDQEFGSIVYVGTFSTGTLLAGNYSAAGAAAAVYMTTTMATATPLWAVTAAPPLGTTAAAGQVVYVGAAVDFATSAKVLAGTAGTDSGVSVSTDSGLNFVQIGFVDTVLNHFDDFQINSDGTTQFLATSTAAAGGADALLDSLWKSVDSGTTWTRILALATANNSAIVRLSPAYATDATLFYAETGNAPAAATAIRVSTNGGVLFVPRISPVAIADIAIKDVNNFWIGSAAANTVTGTTTGGWTYGTAKTLTGATGVGSIVRDAGGDILVGSITGLVYRSADSGTTFTAQGAAFGAAGRTLVAFDSNYATSKAIYAGDATGAIPGIFRFVVGTSTAWTTTAIDAGATAIPSGIVSVGGVLYAANATAAGAAVGGVERSLNATALAPTFEAVATDDGLTAAYTLRSLVATSANKLFAIENSGGAAANRVMTYTDTIITGPELTVGTVGSGSAAFTWTAITGATSYHIELNTRVDFLGAVTGTPATYVAPDTSATITGLASGVTYYARVRVANVAGTAGAPVLSNWSATQTFITALVPVGAPVAIQPLPGSQNVVITPTFSWGAVAGATSYKIELAKKTDFSDAVIGTALINAWTAPSVLSYATVYYWRVTPMSSAGAPAGTPIIGVFTTMSMPVAATPPVVVQQLPAPQITLEVPPAETPPTPGYIWAIIGIGAVLVVAMLVLIWSTRRARV